MKFFPDVNAAKTFTDIIKITDYLLEGFTQLYDTAKTANQNHHERKIKFSNIFDICIKLINDYKLKQPQDSIADKVFMTKHEFDIKRTGFNDLELIYSLFFLPINKLIANFLRENARNNYLTELFFYTSKGREFYEDILAGYQEFEEEIKLLSKDINEQIDKIDKSSSKFLSSEVAKI